MRWPAAAALAVCCLGAFGAVAESAEPDAGSPAARATLVRADPALLQQAFEETGAARHVESVGWTPYAGHLARRLWRPVERRLRGVLTRFSELGSRFGSAIAIAAATALCGLIGLLAWIAIRFAVRRRPANDARETSDAATEPATVRPADAVRWKATLEHHLVEGRILEALEAAWWWIAGSLMADDVDPAWTGRELIERAGRADLTPAVRRLDHMTYGSLRPGVEEIRSWVHRVEGRL